MVVLLDAYAGRLRYTGGAIAGSWVCLVLLVASSLQQVIPGVKCGWLRLMVQRWPMSPSRSAKLDQILPAGVPPGQHDRGHFRGLRGAGTRFRTHAPAAAWVCVYVELLWLRSAVIHDMAGENLKITAHYSSRHRLRLFNLIGSVMPITPQG